MPPRTISLRELNRTTLARQLLLERASLSVSEALERVVGLQAQQARPPYIGLWTRLVDFDAASLSSLLQDRRVVKATFIRATLHLLTTDDYFRFRETLQPVLTSALEDLLATRGASVDVGRLVEAAREFIAADPRSFADITKLFATLEPDGDPGGMRYAVRTHLPLVQVPTRTRWSFPGNPKFTLAEAWLGRGIPNQVHREELVRRYLAAFGPATVRDMQTWCYLDDLAPVFERLELVRYRDERGRELFDLPSLTVDSDERAAPVRFLPEFDNLLLGHQDRSRVIASQHRKQVFLPGLRVAATVLIDGFVAGTWQSSLSRGSAELTVSLFASPDRRTRAEIEREGNALLQFVEPDAKHVAVEIT